MKTKLKIKIRKNLQYIDEWGSDINQTTKIHRYFGHSFLLA